MTNQIFSMPIPFFVKKKYHKKLNFKKILSAFAKQCDKVFVLKFPCSTEFRLDSVMDANKVKITIVCKLGS